MSSIRLVDGHFSSLSEDINVLNLYIFRIRIIYMCVHTKGAEQMAQWLRALNMLLKT